MSIIDRILTALAPYECLGCAAEGDLLCTPCIKQLTNIPERCYRCLRPSAAALTCYECSKTSHLYRVRAGTAYSGPAKELVLRLKFAGARGAAQMMRTRLLPLLVAAPEVVIVPVPTAASRVRGRGYDQAKLLAHELSRQARLPYLDCLTRSGHTRQVGTSRRQRLSQLDGAFRVSSLAATGGAGIVLVDDVLTTGATLEAAAKVLKTNGAGRIEAMVFAQA